MKAQSKAQTEIGNSSFTLDLNKSRKKRSFFAPIVSSVLALSLFGCGSLQTRDELGKKESTEGGQAPTSTQTPSPSVTGSVGLPPQPQQPQQPPAPPTFLNKELPKVGVILGPGGFKTFAHLGVLREMSRARIPIHAITGLEWGAVMAGLYAIQGQVNDAEWKAFKLRENEVPTAGGFMSSRIKAMNTSELGDFFDSAYGSNAVEKSKIKFACPSYAPKSDRTAWIARGQHKVAAARCLAYPPLYVDNGGGMASPFSVDEAAAWLRSQGANVIVLINALGQGEYLPTKLSGEHYNELVLWSEIRRQMLRAKSPVVNHVININTSGHPITDFAGRRALMDAGQKSATDAVNKIVSQYGF